ncbi:MAG: hypothetical protein ACOWWO_09940 [Peptococcaceae bacterium]
MRKGDIKIAFTYVGAIVGAGFASGQELIKFFVAFNNYGLIGTVFTGIIFALLGSLVIILVNKINIRDYGQLLRALFPRKIYKIMDIMISLTLWVGLGVMLSGSGTLINEQLKLPSYLGFIVTAVMVVFCLQLGSKGLLNTNCVLVPFLIILAIGCSMIYIIKPVACFSQSGMIKSLLPNWWTASLLYAAYNMVLGIVVMSSIKDKEEDVSPVGGIIGGAILGLMSFIMVKGLLLLPAELQIRELPMLAMTTTLHPLAGTIYGISLWIALFTTALANAHSLTIRVSNKINKPYRLILILIVASALSFIPWKFSLLISVIYPIEGYLAIPLILAIIIAVVKKKN